MNNWTVFCV